MPDRVRKWDLIEGEIIDEEDQTASQKCPDCGVYNHIDNIECHWCGADLTDEGKKEGTCRRCSNWKDGGCKFQDSIFKPCPIWLYFTGCPSFTRRGRSLPAVVDGELKAIMTNGDIYDLKQRVNEKKEEIKTNMEKGKTGTGIMREYRFF